jgi:drug/metabolite transporter (DMT)-like permease
MVVHHPEGIHSLLYITILAVLGSAMAIILVVRLIQASSALFGSFVTYLIPVISIMWGLIAGETINFVTLCSLLLILSGIIIAGL